MTSAKDGKRILLLGGKERLVPAVDRARELGLTVLVADGNPAAPALQAADAGFPVDISDEAAIYDLAREQSIDGILSLSEFGVVAAASAAQRLGLPAISVDTAHRATDKHAMRQAWADAGLPQPSFTYVDPSTDISLFQPNVSWPVIVKPCWSSAGRGIIRVDQQDQLLDAMRNARQVDRRDRILVEQYVVATQYNCECFIGSNGMELLAICAKTIEDTRQCVTWGHFYGPVSDELRSRLERLLMKATAALGIESGCVHAEILFDGKELWLLEMAARGGGGDIFTSIIEHVSGFDVVTAAIRQAMGETVTVQRTRELAAGYEFLNAPSGKLIEIQGVDEAMALPFVSDIGFSISIGDQLEPVTDGAHRPCWIVVLADSHEQVREAIDQAAGLIRFVVK